MVFVGQGGQSTNILLVLKAIVTGSGSSVSVKWLTYKTLIAANVNSFDIRGRTIQIGCNQCNAKAGLIIVYNASNIFNSSYTGTLNGLTDLPVIYTIAGNTTSSFASLGEKVVIDNSNENAVFIAFTSRSAKSST